MNAEGRRILGRIESGKSLDRFRRKVHDLRKLVAGDLSPLGVSHPQKDDDAEDVKPKSYTTEDLYDILCQDIQEGQDNKLLQAVKILVMQVGFRFPDIEFGDELTAAESAFNSEYLKDRLGPQPVGCAGADHGRLALTDYATGGLGWLGTVLREGVPILEHWDTIDMTWDQHATVITDIKWQSVKIRNPLYVWLELYKGKESLFKDALGNGFDSDERLDKSLQVEFYFDRIGENGTQCAFICQGQGRTFDKPLESVDNPYYFLVAGRKVPMLPGAPMYYMHLMSVRQPIGVVEMMLANQTAIYDADETIRETVKRGKPFWNIEDGSYDEEELTKFETGDTGSILVHKSGKKPAVPSSALEISKTLPEWRQKNENSLVAAGGYNPYATGNRVEGVEFSSEVAAIEGHAGLVAGSVAMDYTSLWSRATQQLLAIGSEHDEAPIAFYYDGVRLEFDASDPIKDYLRPDVTPTVREDATQFVPRQTQVALAERDLSIAAKVSAYFPNALPLAYENYLRATGKRNIAKYLEKPMMAPQDPAADAQADAEASTASVM